MLLRQLRHVGPAVSLVFAVFASPASAECAWVLWERVSQRWWSTAQWEAVQGHDSSNSCSEGISLRRQAVGADPADSRNYDGSKWRCLPDNIDPRRPKGGR